MATASVPSSLGVKVRDAAIAATGTSAVAAAVVAHDRAPAPARAGVTVASRTRWAAAASTCTWATRPAADRGSWVAAGGQGRGDGAGGSRPVEVRPSAGGTTCGVVPVKAIVASTGARSTLAATASSCGRERGLVGGDHGRHRTGADQAGQAGPGSQRLLGGGADGRRHVEAEPGGGGGHAGGGLARDDRVLGPRAWGELVLERARRGGRGQTPDVDAGDRGGARNAALGGQQVDTVGGGQREDGSGRHQDGAPPPREGGVSGR